MLLPTHHLQIFAIMSLVLSSQSYDPEFIIHYMIRCLLISLWSVSGKCFTVENVLKTSKMSVNYTDAYLQMRSNEDNLWKINTVDSSKYPQHISVFAKSFCRTAVRQAAIFCRMIRTCRTEGIFVVRILFSLLRFTGHFIFFAKIHRTFVRQTKSFCRTKWSVTIVLLGE